MTAGPDMPGNEPTLCVDDQRAIDALVEAGFDARLVNDRASVGGSSGGGIDPRRIKAVNNLLGLMNDYPVDDCEPALLDATLARIDRLEDERAARLNFDVRQEEAHSSGGGGRRIRMPDFITVAAVILIGVGILWPTLSVVRQKSMDDACANNMRQVGMGLSNYAADNNGAIPMARAGIGGFGGLGATGASWDTVPNALNFRPLIEGGYCEHHHLNCPGHEEDQIGPSYSYRWQNPQAPVQWHAGRSTPVFADRNPVIDAVRNGRVIAVISGSINHGGRGQNVLINDGQVIWLKEPVFVSSGRRDNIWLPNGVEELRPGELPREVLDVFLAH